MLDFYDKFQQVAKNIKEFSFFFTFVLVNHLTNDHHFNLHQKIKEKKKKKKGRIMEELWNLKYFTMQKYNLQKKKSSKK